MHLTLSSSLLTPDSIIHTWLLSSHPRMACTAPVHVNTFLGRYSLASRWCWLHKFVIRNWNFFSFSIFWSDPFRFVANATESEIDNHNDSDIVLNLCSEETCAALDVTDTIRKQVEWVSQLVSVCHTSTFTLYATQFIFKINETNCDEIDAKPTIVNCQVQNKRRLRADQRASYTR